MSLRDLGVFEPLPKDHPGVGMKCWTCKRVIGAGTRTALQAIETPDETGSCTVGCELVCATCFLRGARIMTAGGERIVERVKDGDASPYPVETTDGHQWERNEVDPV